MNPFYPNLFRRLTIKGITFRNRISSAPTMMSHMDFTGRPDESLIDYFAEKAFGGAAVVTLGDTPVDREHAATNPRSFALTPENLPKISEIVRAIHAGGALASHELNHGGITATRECNFGGEDWEAWGPVERHEVVTRVLHGNEITQRVDIHGMTEEDMQVVANHFAESAVFLKRAGYDMVLIHGGHGWLLDQFLSPLFNTRTDEYGGSLANRAKFPLMVVDAVRKSVGDDFLIEYRMSGSEEIEGGLSKEEGIEFAKMLDGKVDIIHVSAGLDTAEAQVVHTHPTMFLPHGVNVHYAAAIKAAGVKTPVATIGGITDPALAEQILAEGKADIVCMTRPLIADPYLPTKAKFGRDKEIIPCQRCMDCLAGLHAGSILTCAVNLRTAQEGRIDRVAPAKCSRKVLVVGGGPGGMKAAATAAQRGHQVTLADSADRLGGMLKFTDRDPLKEDLKRLKDHLIHMMEISGVDVRLNTTVTPEYITDGGYDAVILAVGATAATPNIPGLEHAVSAVELHDGAAIGQRVVILGGGLVGCETGLSLAQQGHTVTVLEAQHVLAPEANWMHREGMMQAYASTDATLRTDTRVTRVEAGGVWVGEEFIPADTVISALGLKSNLPVVEQLEDVCIDTALIGDCVRPRKARHAMEEGFWAAVRLG